VNPLRSGRGRRGRESLRSSRSSRSGRSGRDMGRSVRSVRSVRSRPGFFLSPRGGGPADTHPPKGRECPPPHRGAGFRKTQNLHSSCLSGANSLSLPVPKKNMESPSIAWAEYLGWGSWGTEKIESQKESKKHSKILPPSAGPKRIQGYPPGWEGPAEGGKTFDCFFHLFVTLFFAVPRLFGDPGVPPPPREGSCGRGMGGTHPPNPLPHVGKGGSRP